MDNGNPHLQNLIGAMAELLADANISDGVYKQSIVMEIKDGNLMIHSFDLDEVLPVKKKPAISLDTKL